MSIQNKRIIICYKFFLEHQQFSKEPILPFEKYRHLSSGLNENQEHVISLLRFEPNTFGFQRRDLTRS